MPDGSAGYIRLFDLAGLWARAGGIPHLMVFRRLCYWAAYDAFPPGALVDRFEQAIRPSDIYFDIEAAMRGDWAVQGRLEEILVRVSDLPSFCDRTNTILPLPLLQGRVRRWRAARGGKHLVPPACPEAVEKFEPRKPAALPTRLVAGGGGFSGHRRRRQ